MLLLILAIAIVESGCNTSALNVEEDAVGYLQIRPCVVEDVNRILGNERFSLDDRYDKQASIEMFKIYTLFYYNHYKSKIKMSEHEARARIWNGGPKGWQKSATKKYWRKVREQRDNEKARLRKRG